MARAIVKTFTPTLPPIPPVFQEMLSSSGTYNLYYSFIILSGSATAGATYTNNGVTFTVYATVAGSTLIQMSGNGAPLASGALIKTSGTGDATLTFSNSLKPDFIEVELVGGGGGGAGGGAGGTNGAGGGGGVTYFGVGFLTADGGAGCPSGTQASGSGGVATITAPAFGSTFTGAAGPGTAYSGSANYCIGNTGGSSIYGGAGVGLVNEAGRAAQANSGSGGGGGSHTLATNHTGGGGGGAGGGIKAIVPNPTNTYSWIVGPGGAGGTAGTNGFVGGAGGSGRISTKITNWKLI